MPPPSDHNNSHRVEILVSELKAIEQFDADYWQKGRPEVYETLAYDARRERRKEVLSELRCLIANNEKLNLWTEKPKREGTLKR
jgi:hypothetical protein